MKKNQIFKTISIMLLVIATLAFMTNMGYSKNMAFGAKVGVNSASINVSSDSGFSADTNSRTDFLIGLLFEYSLTPAFALQPELLYIGKGAKASVGDAEWKLTYLEIPVMFKFNLSSGNVKPFLEAGPYFASKLSAKDKMETN